MISNLKNFIFIHLKEDEEVKERIAAKNKLETYCYNMRQTLDDEKVSAKLSAEDKKVVGDMCADTLHWLDSNTTATKEEFEFKLNEAEQACNPVISRLYQPSGGEFGPAPGQGGDGPKIDEVD